MNIQEVSPSRIINVRLISLGMTILPKSSTRRTIPVAFIYLHLPNQQIMVVVFVIKGELYLGLLHLPSVCSKMHIDTRGVIYV